MGAPNRRGGGRRPESEGVQTAGQGGGTPPRPADAHARPGGGGRGIAGRGPGRGGGGGGVPPGGRRPRRGHPVAARLGAALVDGVLVGGEALWPARRAAPLLARGRPTRRLGPPPVDGKK